MKILRILGTLLFFLGGLATLAVIIDERTSRHESDWRNRHSERFNQDFRAGR